MRISLALLVVAGLAVRAYPANCAPERMLKVVTSAEIPDVLAGHFALQPKTTYRLGNKYGRIEELRNPETNLHLLIIVNEPDVWVVNQVDGSGQHIVDPGPSLNFRAPIIANLTSTHWNEFEFGCEESFMKQARASFVKRDDGSISYSHEAEGVHAVLIVGQDGRPRRVEATTAEGKLALKYVSYDWLEPNIELFSKPKAVTFREREQ